MMLEQDLSGKRIALIGCGDIGCRVGSLLVKQGAEIHAFRRNIQQLPATFHAQTMDVQAPETLSTLSTSNFDYIVVTLSPDTLSDEAYAATYVNGLKHILQAINREALSKLFWVSSTSVYGQSDGRWIDENSPTVPTRFSGKRQLEAEQLLTALKDKACIIRFAGIYRDKQHRLIEKVRRGELSATIDNDYFTNRIHVDDCAGVITHLIQQDANHQPLANVYIGSDCSPVLYSDLITWIAKALNVTLSKEGAAAAPRVGSKRCANQRLLDSGYAFIYPSYQQGFCALL